MGSRAGCVLLIALAALIASACDDGGEQSVDDANKVTICHSTGSSSNPYVQNQPAKSADVHGHDGHPDDIIPPFDFFDNAGVKQQYPGKNWPAGQATWAADCDDVARESVLPATDKPLSTEAKDGTVPASNAPPSAPTTARPGTTTTGATTAGPTTTRPGTTTTSPTTGSTTPRPPATTASPGNTDDAGATPPIEVVPPGESTTTTRTPTTNPSGTAEAEAPLPPGSTPDANSSSTPTSSAAGGGSPAQPEAGGSVSPDNGDIPATGGTNTTLVVVGALLLCLGAVAVTIARRRVPSDRH